MSGGTKKTIISETEEKINTTFNQMKTCLVEMKKAIESDMDRRDDTYSTNENHWHDFRSLSLYTHNLIHRLLRTVKAVGEDNAEDYKKEWEEAYKELDDLQEFYEFCDKEQKKILDAEAASTSETSAGMDTAVD